MAALVLTFYCFIFTLQFVYTSHVSLIKFNYIPCGPPQIFFVMRQERQTHRDTQRWVEVTEKERHKKARVERQSGEVRAGEVREGRPSSSGQNWAPRSDRDGSLPHAFFESIGFTCLEKGSNSGNRIRK